MSLTREALLIEALKEGTSLAQALDAARAAWQWLQDDMSAPPPVAPAAPVANPVSSAREAELALIQTHMATHGAKPWSASVEAKTGGLTPGQLAAQKRLAEKKK